MILTRRALMVMFRGRITYIVYSILAGAPRGAWKAPPPLFYEHKIDRKREYITGFTKYVFSYEAFERDHCSPRDRMATICTRYDLNRSAGERRTSRTSV